MFGRKAIYMGTDINFMALEATSRTKTQNKCDIDLI